MLKLSQLKILNFKNYSEAQLDFCEGVNVLTGDNGVGKTNILDAIHYLSLCKSYFNAIDSQQIKFEEDFFMIQGTFENEMVKDEILCSLKKNQKKVFKRNKKDYPKLADHVGHFPIVMITPYDANLILDGSEERRKLIDTIISQMDRAYLDQLIAYNKNLLNRNSYLKQAKVAGKIDETLLQIYDEQLVQFGNMIYQKRHQFMIAFESFFHYHYGNLSQHTETVHLQYQSQLEQVDFATLLLQARSKDLVLERTTVGIHKDELLFTIHEMPLKKFASQGQQKTFLIALKLAQYSYLQNQKNSFPLLLLDDIFDKLDEHRILKLMQMVSQNQFGQIFITDTDAERVQRIFKKIAVPIKIFNIEKGVVHVA